MWWSPWRRRGRSRRSRSRLPARRPAVGPESVTIQGEPVVGATLTAMPRPRIRRVPIAVPLAALPGASAAAASAITRRACHDYTVAVADVGLRACGARRGSPPGPAQRVGSPLNRVVTARPPPSRRRRPSTPTPTPTPTPDADARRPTPRTEPRDEPATFEQSGQQAEPPPTATSPAGELLADAAAADAARSRSCASRARSCAAARVIDLFRVKAPVHGDRRRALQRARAAACGGASFGTGRIAALERFLPRRHADHDPRLAGRARSGSTCGS